MANIKGEFEAGMGTIARGANAFLQGLIQMMKQFINWGKRYGESLEEQASIAATPVYHPKSVENLVSTPDWRTQAEPRSAMAAAVQRSQPEPNLTPPTANAAAKFTP